MARRIYRSHIRFHRQGNLNTPNVRRAVAGAMAEFAPILQRSASALARRRVKNSPSRDNRGRRRYRKSMADSYVANVLSGGNRISLYNSRLRGRIFEVGSRRHWIRRNRLIIPGHPIAFRSPKPGGPLHFRQFVDHPGQRGQFVIAETLDNEARTGERLIDRAVERALSG